MTTLDFLQAYFENADTDNFAYLYTLPGKRTYTFPPDDLESMAAKAKELSDAKQNVYFGVGLRKTDTTGSERAKADDIAEVPGFWIDIDIKGPAHKSEKLPTDIVQALSVLPPELEPSMKVNSGHGIYAFWLLKESLDDTKQASDIVARIQAFARGSGFDIDATHDVSRVLRVPGTMNYKISGRPVPVELFEIDENKRYNPDDFDFLPPVSVVAREKSRGDKFRRLADDGPAQNIIDNCAFVRGFLDGALPQSEPLWMAVATNVMRAKDGEAVMVAAVKKWQGENVDEKKTNERLQHYLTGCGPQSCEYIRATHRYPGCEGCHRHDAVNPAWFALSKLGRAVSWARERRKITNADLEAPELKLLCDQGGAYKDEVWDKMDGVKRAFNQQQKEADIDERMNPTAIAGIDFICPGGYQFSMGAGISKVIQSTGNTKRLTSTPVIIGKHILNVDTNQKSVEVRFCTPGVKGWKSITMRAAAAFSGKSLMEAADSGLNISDSTAKDLAEFLRAFDGIPGNVAKMDYVESVSRLGWRGKSFVLPGDDKYEIDMTGDGGITDAMHASGTLDDWRRLAGLAKTDVARFIVDAAFAGPLLSLTGSRNQIFHIYGPSQGGKTALLTIAASAWGEPKKFMKSFNATKTAHERNAKVANDTLLVVNERETLQAKDADRFVDELIYMWEGGQTKGRGNPDGLRGMDSWRLTVLTSGERQLTRESSLMGTKTRVIEIKADPFIAEADCADVYDLSADNYGMAARMFIDRLKEVDRAEIKKLLRDTEKRYREEMPDKMMPHIKAVSVVAVAGMYMRQWIMGEKLEDVKESVLQSGIAVLTQQAGKNDAKDWQRAKDFVDGWIAGNVASFSFEGKDARSIKEIGAFLEGGIYVYPAALREALAGAGFVPNQIISQFADNGVIYVDTENGKRRSTVVKRHRGKAVRFIHIVGDLPKSGPILSPPDSWRNRCYHL